MWVAPARLGNYTPTALMYSKSKGRAFSLGAMLDFATQSCSGQVKQLELYGHEEDGALLTFRGSRARFNPVLTVDGPLPSIRAISLTPYPRS